MFTGKFGLILITYFFIIWSYYAFGQENVENNTIKELLNVIHNENDDNITDFSGDFDPIIGDDTITLYESVEMPELTQQTYGIQGLTPVVDLVFALVAEQDPMVFLTLPNTVLLPNSLRDLGTADIDKVTTASIPLELRMRPNDATKGTYTTAVPSTEKDERIGTVPTTTNASETTTKHDGSRLFGLNGFLNFRSLLRNLPIPTTTAEYTNIDTRTVNQSEQNTTLNKPSQSTVTNNIERILVFGGNESLENQTQRTNVITSTSQSKTTSTSHVHISNVTKALRYVTIRRMRGYPPICNQEACNGLYTSNKPLEMCEIPGAKAGLVFVVIIISLMIIVGNCLLPIVVWKNRELRTQHNLMKVSLAFADILTGLVLLFSGIPNIIWTMEKNERELVDLNTVTSNSATAVILGIMLTLSAEASLLHLTYLSIERFVAIKWPLWHRVKGKKSLSTQIAIIWGISIFAACIPAAFTDAFSFDYLPVLFVYIMTDSSKSNGPGIIYLVVTMVIPFVATTIFTALTGITVWRKMKSTAHMKKYSTRHHRSRNDQNTQKMQPTSFTVAARNRFKSDSEPIKQRLKPEVAVFKTTVIMIVAFCVTLTPIMVVLCLVYAGYYDCTFTATFENQVIPYTSVCSNYSLHKAAAFYASLSNSFINVLIYTARDKKFRSGLRRAFGCGRFHSWSMRKTNKTTITGTTNTAPSPHPNKMTTIRTASGKARWERALVGL